MSLNIDPIACAEAHEGISRHDFVLEWPTGRAIRGGDDDAEGRRHPRQDHHEACGNNQLYDNGRELFGHSARNSAALPSSIPVPRVVRRISRRPQVHAKCLFKSCATSRIERVIKLFEEEPKIADHVARST